MGVLSDILRLIQQNGAATPLLGAAVGGIGGALLNQEDPGTGGVMGAIAGGGLGALASRRPRVPQLMPDSTAFATDIDRWGAPIDDAQRQITGFDRLHMNLVDERSPAYFGNREVEQRMSNLTHGGMGEALLYQQDLINELERLEGLGLKEEARIWLGSSTVPRSWDTLRQHAEQAYDEAALAHGRGDTRAFAAAKARYDEIMAKINNRQVATRGLDEYGFEAEREAQKARLLPEQYAEVEGFGTKFQDLLWRITEARNRMGHFAPEEFAKWQAQREKGIPYFPAFKNEQEMTPEGHLLRELKEKAQFAKLRGISVPGLEELDAFKPMQGSTLPLDDPLAAGFYYVQESIRQAKRNEATRTFIDGAYANAPARADGTPFIRELRPGEGLQPGEGTVSFLEGGEARQFAVPVEWSDLLHGADAREISAGLEVMGRIQRINAAAITGMNIGFIAANVPRDIQAAWILLRHNPGDFGKFLNYWGKAFKASLEGDVSDPRTREAFVEGAIGANLTRQLKHQPDWRAVASKEQSGVLSTIVSRLQSVTGAAEDATKIAAFSTLRDRGMEPAEAAFMTRRYAGSPDFQRWGKLAPSIRPLVQFWNPQIQGIARNIERAAQDPAYMASWAGALTAGYLAVDAINQSQINPDTGRPWIEDVPQWERSMNLIITLPLEPVTYSNGVTRAPMIKIPLDHVARLLLSPIISLAQNMRGDPNAPTFAQALSNFGSQMLPLAGPVNVEKPFSSAALQGLASTNPLLRIPVEQAMDRQAFSDQPIVGARLSGLEPELQYTESTSPIARTVAGLVGTSPVRTEHVLRSVLPGMGSQIMDAVDMRQRVSMPPQEIAQRFPGLGAIMSRFMVGRGSAERDRLGEDLYQKLEDSDRAIRSLNVLKERGDEEGIQEYLETHRGTLAAGSAVRKMTAALADLRRRREAMLRDENLTPEERHEQIKRFSEIQMRIYRASIPVIELANQRDSGVY